MRASRKNTYRLIWRLLVGASLCTIPSGLAQDVTPFEYLATKAKPSFKPGHSLPPLTKSAYPFASNTTVELAKNWGYALDVGGDVYYTDWYRQITNAPIKGYVALAKSQPSVFKLAINLEAHLHAPIPNGLYVTNASGLFVDRYASNSWSDPTSTTYAKVVSPESPDSYWQEQADYLLEAVRTLETNAHVSMILNPGGIELGLPVPAGGNWTAWTHDPRIVGRTNGLQIHQYATYRRAKFDGFLTKRVREEFTNRTAYILYNTGVEATRRLSPPWDQNWGFGSYAMVTNTDILSFECYYMGYDGQQWTGNFDLLTRYLNCVGYSLALNPSYTTNYCWVSGGWNHGNYNPSNWSDIPRYTGFLKCLYTGGMIGAAAGYFDIPTNSGGFNATFPSNTPPEWLKQTIALARVHAQFSWLEDYMWNGDLLVGNGVHRYSTDQPSYEFTNTVANANARVLARKHRQRNEWLITAWAADGVQTNVTVNITGIGNLTLTASATGSVYRATTTNVTLLADAQILPPTNLRAGNTNSP